MQSPEAADDQRRHIKPEITSGNVWSMITTVVGFAGLIFAGASYISEIDKKNTQQDQRLQHVEQDVGRIERDQDIGIEKIERKLESQDNKLDQILQALGDKADRDELQRGRAGEQ